MQCPPPYIGVLCELNRPMQQVSLGHVIPLSRYHSGASSVAASAATCWSSTMTDYWICSRQAAEIYPCNTKA